MTHFRFASKDSGPGYVVELDGVDIAHHLAGLSIEATPNGVDVTLHAQGNFDLDVDAKVTVEPRWRVIRRYGRSYAIHPDLLQVFASASHAAAIAYADRLARQEVGVALPMEEIRQENKR